MPVISACTLLSRVLGLVRDVLWTAHFGAGMASSAWAVAVTVPNVFRALFGEGAVNSAMVPTFTESLKTRTAEETQKLYAVTFTAMLLTLGAITLLVELGLGAAALAGNYSGENRLFIRYAAAMMPYMPLICLAGYFMAVLNAQKHFFAPAFMPAILNVVWIAAILLFARFPVEDAVLYVSFSTLLAGLLQVLFQVPFARKRGWKFALDFDFAYPPFRQIVFLLVPVLIGSGVIEINVLVNRMLAFKAVPYEGAPACLFFADRLVQIPMAMVGLAISTAVLPALSAHAVLLDMGEFRRTLGSAVRTTMFLVIPASIGLIALAEPMVEVFFRRGAFDVEAAQRTAWVIRLYGIGLWAQSGIFVLLRAFYALKDTKTPVRVSIATVCLNLALNLSVVWFLAEKGLALSTAVCAMAQFVVLYALLRRRLGSSSEASAKEERIEGRATLVSAVETLSASLVMGGVAYLGWHFFWPAHAGILARAAALAGIVLVSAGVFVAAAAMLGVDEMKRILRLGRRKA